MKTKQIQRTAYGIIASLIVAAVCWAGAQLVEVATLKKTTEDQWESIRGLIDLHLKR